MACSARRWQRVTEIAVIVAAGQGTRLGGVAKALLPLGDATFLQTILRTANAAGVTAAMVVVAAPFADAVAAHARANGALVVVNPAPQRGMASSIALGFAALSQLPSTVTAAWLWPVDHPWVSAATLACVRAAGAGFDAAIPVVASEAGPRGGHPVWLARAAWPVLANCAELPQGARSALATLHTTRVLCDDSGVLRDCDTPPDMPGPDA